MGDDREDLDVVGDVMFRRFSYACGYIEEPHSIKVYRTSEGKFVCHGECRDLTGEEMVKYSGGKLDFLSVYHGWKFREISEDSLLARTLENLFRGSS